MILTLLLSFVISISAGGQEECGDVTLIKPLCDVLNSTIKMDQNEPSKCINNENQGKWIKTGHRGVKFSKILKIEKKLLNKRKFYPMTAIFTPKMSHGS